MAESYSTLIEQFPWVATLVGITCLVLAAWLTNSVFKRLILRGIHVYSLKESRTLSHAS